MFHATASAKSIRTPAGNMPRVQWAIVESTAGTMSYIYNSRTIFLPNYFALYLKF